jgi:hypothetical protein
VYISLYYQIVVKVPTKFCAVAMCVIFNNRNSCICVGVSVGNYHIHTLKISRVFLICANQKFKYGFIKAAILLNFWYVVERKESRQKLCIPIPVFLFIN